MHDKPTQNVEKQKTVIVQSVGLNEKKKIKIHL